MPRHSDSPGVRTHTRVPGGTGWPGANVTQARRQQAQGASGATQVGTDPSPGAAAANQLPRCTEPCSSVSSRPGPTPGARRASLPLQLPGARPSWARRLCLHLLTGTFSPGVCVQTPRPTGRQSLTGARSVTPYELDDVWGNPISKRGHSRRHRGWPFGGCSSTHCRCTGLGSPSAQLPGRGPHSAVRPARPGWASAPLSVQPGLGCRGLPKCTWS